MTMVKPHELAQNCMAGIDPDFARQVKTGDVVVAGVNTGYGSSREQAPQSLRHAGIKAVIGQSFARIFYRNCYNVGLPAIICPEFAKTASKMDQVEIKLEEGILINQTTGKEYAFTKPPSFLQEYIRWGGLIPYLASRLQAEKK